MIEKIFGLALQKHRRQLGLSQEKLALFCNLDRTYISLLERGLRNPSLKTIFILAEALEVSPSQLITEIEMEIVEIERTTYED